VPLVWALPPIADLRDRTLPRGLEPVAVTRLLASCDRRRLVGRRDFAILLLLSRLGLRAGEVAGLRLDDVDWRRGLLLIRGKGGRYDELPLPDDVGQALVVVPAASAALPVAGGVCAGDRTAPGAEPVHDRLGRACRM
jgi:integrase/recombinase XerD